MDVLNLAALLVYTAGALTYGALLVVWVRELGRVGWGGRTAGAGQEPGSDLLNGGLTVVSFLWFCVLIAHTLVAIGTGPRPHFPIEQTLMVLAYAFPPLIVHLTWSEARRHGNPVPARWRHVIPAAYVLCAALPIGGLWYFGRPGLGVAERLAGVRVMNVGLSAAFIGTAVFCMAVVRRSRTQERAPRKPGERPWLLVMFALMLLLFVGILYVSESGGATRDRGRPIVMPLIEHAARSLPLLFVFVSTYYENRFQFFDLFVKRGVPLLAMAVILTAWFAAVLPVLAPAGVAGAAPWVFAVTLLPVVALAPWLYGRVGRVLDRRWLGRRYSTVEAVTRFLSGLRSATSEATLTARAEEGLSEIFRAPAMVRLDGPGTPAPFEVRHEEAVTSPSGAAATFLLGPRESDAPYFSQDAALVRSLADVFAPVLDNLRLQQRRLEEEQRARELTLIASQSELKALRAQINPHFLFNALNAIAGLIHRDPAVADRTIEKLADVFRYALRGSETEWARLEDEIEFVRAYLDVEQARFGDRLETAIEIAPSAAGARVPTMIVQTLVENAVKHGAASLRGRARIHVTARVDDGVLRIEVSDNGPGLAAEPGRREAGQGGYGLANIRQRLSGYFGGEAALELRRDATAGVTVATVSLPRLLREPARAGAGR